jgi:hypothetical protein
MSEQHYSKSGRRVLLGHIGVDSGTVLIGDPCYVLQDKPPADLLENWLTRLGQFYFDLGHAGAGVICQTLYGDGCYPVFAELDRSGRPISVTIEFDHWPADAVEGGDV